MEARGLLEFEKLHKTLPKTAKSGAVHAQLNDVFGKIFYFNNLFSQKCKFICFFICQSTVFFFLQIFSARNFSRFFFNFINQIARTFGRAVEKLLPGSMVNSHGQFIFGKQKVEFVSRQHGFPLRKPTAISP